jgi:hypothetical protein
LGEDKLDEVDAIQKMSKAEITRIENELLFSVQGVGAVKNINGYKVYVKDQHA